VPVISANGARFHVQRLGPGADAQQGGPLVVFVHGLVMDNLSSFYYTLAVPVITAGARVLLYDLRGHGRSERTPRGYTTRDSAADLCALLDACGVTEPAYLVGNSYGGLVAARTALLAPERVAGLALIEASCAGSVAGAWLESILNGMSTGALSLEYQRTAEAFREAGQRKIAKMAEIAESLLNETSLIDDLAGERPLDAAEMAGIRCPVLAVYGEHSDLAGGAADLRRHVRDCQVEFVGGLAHTVLRDASGTLRGILLDWLLRQAPATAGLRGAGLPGARPPADGLTADGHPATAGAGRQ
jgi:pimeloyl-ACP methyl ester carboxylesterase